MQYVILSEVDSLNTLSTCVIKKLRVSNAIQYIAVPMSKWKLRSRLNRWSKYFIFIVTASFIDLLLKHVKPIEDRLKQKWLLFITCSDSSRLNYVLFDFNIIWPFCCVAYISTDTMRYMPIGHYRLLRYGPLWTIFHQIL